MRILFINSFFSKGGPPSIIQGIYDTMRTKGHDCLLAASREEPISGMNYYKIGADYSQYFHAIGARLTDAEGRLAYHDTIRLINKIKEWKPDIINLHNLHGYYLNYPTLFSFIKDAKIPVVWTLHDCWAFTGHCAYYDYAECQQWKSGCEHCKCKAEYPKAMFMSQSRWNYQKKREAFSDVDRLTIVTPSIWLADEVKDSFLKQYRVEVINNGIDTNVFQERSSLFREKWNLENKYIILGVAQVWNKRKGLEFFIQLNKQRHSDEVIVLVGLSKKQKQDLPSDIIGLERTSSVEELVDIYNAADVYVNPTLEDNYPTTNLEAIACHTPVITFATGGSPEAMRGMGRVIIIKNTEEIRKAINMERSHPTDFTYFDRDGIDSLSCFSKYHDLFERVAR